MYVCLFSPFSVKTHFNNFQSDGTLYSCFLLNETWDAYLNRMSLDAVPGDEIVLRYDNYELKNSCSETNVCAQKSEIV